jgi:hypothetical protein
VSSPPVLLELFFLPPIAIARVGNSPTPVEAYTWEEDTNVHSGCRTVVRPATSFEVRPDGSLRAYRPASLVFADAHGVRPVAPFLELWATIADGPEGEAREVPVTSSLLNALGADLAAMRLRVRAGNFKAARRVHDPSCGFVAEVLIRGADYAAHTLDAISPPVPLRKPLVRADRPIRLGTVQVIKPLPLREFGEDLSVFRVRYLPGKGAVYGPEGVAEGACSPLEPGRWLARESMSARVHEIVPPENRILEPDTPWTGYVMDTGLCDDPQPADSYDGANVDGARSWGIVDDTCEATLRLEWVIAGRRYVARTRVIVGQPDYAPDRRPLLTFADDLVDRELPPAPVDVETRDAALRELSDLFDRVFETTGLMNLDAARDYLLRENMKRHGGAASAGSPHTDFQSMGPADRPLARFAPDVVRNGVHDRSLPLTDVARQAHGQLQHPSHLEHLLRTRGELLRRMVRPPFGRFEQLPADPPDTPAPSYRDPRLFRDTLHDMRMPPFMRDSGREPLSITNRQYEALMQLIDLIESESRE